MARIQILELPEGSGDDRPPFILIIDQVNDETAADIARWPDNIATRTGARHVLCFSETIDIPANEVPLDEEGKPLFLKVHIEGEFEKLREQAEEEIRSVQQRMTASLGRAAITDHEHKAALTDALGMDHLRDWDDIRNATAGIRRERDALLAVAEHVRQLHGPAEHKGQTICVECSAYDGSTTDNAPVAHPCDTIRALTDTTP